MIYVSEADIAEHNYLGTEKRWTPERNAGFKKAAIALFGAWSIINAVARTAKNNFVAPAP